MSYQALYRKYRPKNLNEVYGQKVAVNILKNAVQNNKFGHAYLFTGSRGCGKTSVAKILARMVNCDNLVDGIPCGECDNCLNSSSNNCVDILEIDAASNNGVDEIRELKSKVNVIPSALKYKVYIIDEVHMLTDNAFNALLKTLEEPPSHVIFILATTELHMVPSTIISRCQTIEFKKINNSDMFARLKEISESENIKITDDALYEIVNVSDGGLRDAIGLLDMASSYSNDQITDEDILVINGTVSNNEIDYLSDLIIKKNQNTIINLINDYYDSGKDLIKILEKIINSLKNKMIENNDKNICSVITNLSDALNKMKGSSIGKIYLEVEIFKLCNENNIEVENKKSDNKDISKNEIYNDNKINDDFKENINNEISEKNIVTKENINIEKDNVDSESLNKLKKVRINNTFVDVNKQALIKIKTEWEKLNDYTFDKDYGALICELIDSTPVAASNTYLMLSYNYDSFVEKGNMYIQKYENALRNTIGLDMKIIFLTADEWNKLKKEYIENIKNNVKYNYMEEIDIEIKKSDVEPSSNELNQSEIVSKASELFDLDKIEIKEN